MYVNFGNRLESDMSYLKVFYQDEWLFDPNQLSNDLVA